MIEINKLIFVGRIPTTHNEIMRNGKKDRL